ncbi:MAG: hydroxylamine reductase [Anaerolineaceae bacterium]|nr:hydroxylamine reductase [Anaerolineaceae bacterium]
MDEAMFCYQCEQTFRGEGCVTQGVCGKDPDVAALQDLLIHQIEGIGYLANGQTLDNETAWFVIEALFSTLTNVNFSAERFYPMLRKAQTIKKIWQDQVQPQGDVPPAVRYVLPESRPQILVQAHLLNMHETNEEKDVKSLKDTLLFGLKGMAAYAHHAWVLGYRDEGVNLWFMRGLAAMVDSSLNLKDMLSLVMEFGQINLKCMELLDEANTSTYGHPEPTSILVTHKKGPFIVVSGHDLHDLYQILEQTEGTGVNVYTHGELLPGNAYPGLKKFKHLIGNFGGAWQNQQKEFDHLPGCVIMTTNCLMEPRDSYQDRIFTSGVVGFANMTHIEEENGRKDFSPVIQKAIALGGWQEDEPEKRILTGFARNAVLSQADKVVEAVKTGKISHFFLVGGCDGAKPGRNYYTQFTEKTPQDSVIMTLACGKYRFNKREFGTVAGFPRLMDVGQCNDAYSAIRIALALAEAFNCSVNELPLTLVLSWYEQKAVCILLTLLSLGIKNIYLGPTLPAFLSPNVVDFLVKQFDLHPISTPENDLGKILA